MEPELWPGEYVFTTISYEVFKDTQYEIWGWFREVEGVTLILEKKYAVAAGFDYAYPSRMITLTVHSSLEAVGFLAVITNRLAKEGISVNAISAYFHDHLFVPVGKASQTMSILNQIMNENKL